MLARTARDILAAPGLRRLPAIRADYYTIGILVALGLGVLVRLPQVLAADFPLNDGGLFYQMTRDLQAANYRLPEWTTYNGGGIPYAYPPLAFYIAGFLDDVTPFSLLTVFRWLPFVFTSLTLLAFLQLARELLRSRLAVVAALAAFALIPRSFIWLIMGGGVTRSLGLLFAILALTQVVRLYRKDDRTALLLAVLFSAATVLSHLQTGWFLAFSIALFWAFCGRNRQGLTASALLAGGTLLVTAPWWLTVLAAHGAEPFLAANSTGGTVFSNEATRNSVLISLARAISTSEPFFPLIASLGLLGAVLCFASNRFLLPAWWLVIILLDVRAFATYASLPVALLAGIGVDEGLLPLLQRTSAQVLERGQKPLLGGHAKPLFVLGCLLYYAAFAAMVKEPGLGELSSLDPVPVAEREAMSAIRRDTPPGARVLLVPGRSWEVGNDAEWFPVLAARPSVVTVQGREWLPGNAFGRGISAYYAAWACAFEGTACLDQWTSDWGQAFDYVFLPARPGEGPCCPSLASSLRADARYREVWERAGGTLFQRLP